MRKWEVLTKKLEIQRRIQCKFKTKKYKTHNKNLTGPTQQQNGNEKLRVNKLESRPIEIILLVNKKNVWGQGIKRDS